MKHFDQKRINEISRSYREVDIIEAVNSGSGILGLAVGGVVALIVFGVFAILYLI